MTFPKLRRRKLLKLMVLSGLGAMGRPGRGVADDRTTGFSVDPFPRPDMVFDSGAARGADAAVVPISGQAPPDTRIEARWQFEDGSTGAWQDLARTAASGRWQGLMAPLSRADGWAQPQLRRADQPEPLHTMSRVTAGHVVAIWGQSEFHRALLPAHAALSSAPPIHDPLALRVTYFSSDRDGEGVVNRMVHAAIDNATPLTAHMAALSNLLAQAAPGDRFHLIFHAKAGTALQQLLDRANPRRAWENDLALQRFALPEGAAPGLAWMSWYNADASLGAQYGRVLFAALTGRNADGTDLQPGAVPLGGSAPMDHSFSEFYDTDTIWAIAGPHRFEANNFDASIPACRASVNAMFENPRLPPHIRRGLEPLTYLNGNPGWGGDFSHPDTTVAPGDGMTRLIQLMGLSILGHLGNQTWPVPEFDRARLSPDGRAVEVWSTAGPVTTTRAAQGTPLPDGTPVVAGFRIDGAPARHVELSEGRVSIYRDAARSPFDPGMRVSFGADGIGAEDVARDVRDIEVWRDYPIVDLGQPVLEGIPLRALTPQSVLDVIPPAPVDPIRGRNLLTSDLARFVPASRAPGWVVVGEGWQVDPRRATATAALTATGPLRMDTRRRTFTALQGQELVLSFVPTLEGPGEDLLRVRVSATGGGATSLFLDDVVLPHGRRVRLNLGRMPVDRDALSISFQRRGWPTGALTLSDLALERPDG